MAEKTLSISERLGSVARSFQELGERSAPARLELGCAKRRSVSLFALMAMIFSTSAHSSRETAIKKCPAHLPYSQSLIIENKRLLYRNVSGLIGSTQGGPATFGDQLLSLEKLLTRFLVTFIPFSNSLVSYFPCYT